MKLQQVLKHRNVNNEPYLSDIQKWSGIKDFKTLNKIRELLKIIIR